MIWLFAFATIALIVGNWLRKVGVEAARGNPYGSAASLAGQKRSAIGNWINIAGGVCMILGVVWALSSAAAEPRSLDVLVASVFGLHA